MKCLNCLLIACLFVLPVCAQDEPIRPDEFLESVQHWVEENIDPEAVAGLGIDPARLQQFLGELHKQFQGDYVYDLSALHETATNLLPVLLQFEETHPYGLWLQTRLDYLRVPGELRQQAARTPDKPTPEAKRNPPPQLQRSVWVNELDRRPVPPNAAKYVSRLKPVFAAQHVPPELVWLAEVESSFDPRAKSPVGAVGLFQLMPATAKSLKLKLWPVDERKDPEKSAKAAASYLRYLHNRFEDWRLALAAYNAGETRVANLLRKHNASSYDAIAQYLPAETQMYVPKLEATLRQREGLSLSELKAPTA